jgi:serine/threonine protein kinase
MNKAQDIIKLGDFGIAKQLDGTQDLAETQVGTPCYMSPELLNGEPYTFAADIWALGCIAYEVCPREINVELGLAAGALMIRIRTLGSRLRWPRELVQATAFRKAPTWPVVLQPPPPALLQRVEGCVCSPLAGVASALLRATEAGRHMATCRHR